MSARAFTVATLATEWECSEGVIHGDGDDEGLWHNRYFGQRMEGEWFEWSARLAGEIAAALEAGSTRRALGIAEMAPEPHWRERLGLPMVALNHKDTHHA